MTVFCRMGLWLCASVIAGLAGFRYSASLATFATFFFGSALGTSGGGSSGAQAFPTALASDFIL